MHFVITPYAVMNAIGAMISLIAAFFAMRIGSPGSKYLSWMLLASAIWTGGAAMEMATVSIPGQILWAKFQYFGVVSCPVLYLAFTVNYVNPGMVIPGRRLGVLFIIPVITVILALTNESHQLIWTSYTPSPIGNNVTIFGHGPAFYAFVIGYSYLLMLISTFLLVRYLVIHPQENPRQIPLILIAGFAPWIMNILYISGFSLAPGLELTPLTMVFTGVTYDLIIVEGLVYDLRREIVKRELLEQDLRRSQETLLTRLRLHSARLSILFDQVLVREGYSNLDELMPASLAKISSLLNCHSTLYYHFEEENTLVLEASHGGRPGSYNVTFPTPAALMPPTEDVYPYPASRSQGGQTPWRLDGMEESLAKWVFAQDNVLGLLVVNWEEGCLPAVEEIALFGALADTLGLLVENARLRHEIEETAAVLERRRLARDLHDSVTQSLLTLLMYTRKALDETTNPELVTGTLSKMETGARQALKEARLMFFELRRDVFIEGGMLEQITSRLDSVERRAGINAELAVEPGAFWPMEWEYQLFFIVIEALNNSLKHARASAVVVRLKNAGEDFVLEVEDNGRGFHTSSQPAGGMGMTNMAERAEIIGAVFEAGPGSSGGALIRVSGKAGRGEPDTDRGSEVQDG